MGNASSGLSDCILLEPLTHLIENHYCYGFGIFPCDKCSRRGDSHKQGLIHGLPVFDSEERFLHNRIAAHEIWDEVKDEAVQLVPENHRANAGLINYEHQEKHRDARKDFIQFLFQFLFHRSVIPLYNYRRRF